MYGSYAWLIGVDVQRRRPPFQRPTEERRLCDSIQWVCPFVLALQVEVPIKSTKYCTIAFKKEIPNSGVGEVYNKHIYSYWICSEIGTATLLSSVSVVVT